MQWHMQTAFNDIEKKKKRNSVGGKINLISTYGKICLRMLYGEILHTEYKVTLPGNGNFNIKKVSEQLGVIKPKKRKKKPRFVWKFRGFHSFKCPAKWRNCPFKWHLVGNMRFAIVLHSLLSQVTKQIINLLFYILFITVKMIYHNLHKSDSYRIHHVFNVAFNVSLALHAATWLHFPARRLHTHLILYLLLIL